MSSQAPEAYDEIVFELEVATAAHDLRNRLGIAGCEIQQLRLQLAPNLDPGCPAVAECLESIERLLAHTNAQLEGLLELACGQNGVRVTTNGCRLDLVGVVKRLVDLQRCDGSGHKISVVANVQSLRGAWDDARITHVVRILLANAMQFSPIGSAITITLSRQANEAILRVTDRGIGISASDLPHVFEPFFRGRNAAVMPGLGLGLATARLIVEQYGGSLEVESTEGAGATFTARLPLQSV
jgi:signal transduction histidine kinase